MTEKATHRCTTVAHNTYDVIVEGRYSGIARVRVVASHQRFGNGPGSVFAVDEDSLIPLA